MMHSVAVDLMINLKSDLLSLPFPGKIGYKLDAVTDVFKLRLITSNIGTGLAAVR